MSKKFKPYILVTTQDSSGGAHDEQLEALAGKYGGDLSGGGFAFGSGSRDQSFSFTDLDKARKFVTHLYRFKSMRKDVHVHSTCYLHDNDYNYD